MITITPDTATSTLRCMARGLDKRIRSSLNFGHEACAMLDRNEWREQLSAINAELAKREHAEQITAIERQRDAEFRRVVNNTL